MVKNKKYLIASQETGEILTTAIDLNKHIHSFIIVEYSNHRVAFRMQN